MSKGSKRDMFYCKPVKEEQIAKLERLLDSISNQLKKHIFLIVMASKSCYVCKQDRPCCGQPVHLMDTCQGGHTDRSWKEDTEFFEKVVNLWEPTPIWRNCNGVFYGQLYDVKTGEMRTLVLEHNKKKLIGRINLVKSFLFFKNLFICKYTVHFLPFCLVALEHSFLSLHL